MGRVPDAVTVTDTDILKLRVGSTIEVKVIDDDHPFARHVEAESRGRRFQIVVEECQPWISNNFPALPGRMAGPVCFRIQGKVVDTSDTHYFFWRWSIESIDVLEPAR